MDTNNLSQSNIGFLEKVMEQGKLQDLYEARDLTEVIFRTSLMCAAACVWAGVSKIVYGASTEQLIAISGTLTILPIKKG